MGMRKQKWWRGRRLQDQAKTDTSPPEPTSQLPEPLQGVANDRAPTRLAALPAELHGNIVDALIDLIFLPKENAMRRMPRQRDPTDNKWNLSLLSVNRYFRSLMKDKLIATIMVDLGVDPDPQELVRVQEQRLVYTAACHTGRRGEFLAADKLRILYAIWTRRSMDIFLRKQVVVTHADVGGMSFRSESSRRDMGLYWAIKGLGTLLSHTKGGGLMKGALVCQMANWTCARIRCWFVVHMQGRQAAEEVQKYAVEVDLDRFMQTIPTALDGNGQILTGCTARGLGMKLISACHVGRLDVSYPDFRILAPVCNDTYIRDGDDDGLAGLCSTASSAATAELESRHALTQWRASKIMSDFLPPYRRWF